MTAELLAPCLSHRPSGGHAARGDEPRDLIREYYRLRRRASDLTESADVDSGLIPVQCRPCGPDAFLNWYATGHDDIPHRAVTQATATIHRRVGARTSNPDERFVLRLLAAPYRDGGSPDPRRSYFADYANPATAAAAGVDAVVHRAEQDSTVTLPPGPAKQPAPRLQRLFTTRMTGRRGRQGAIPFARSEALLIRGHLRMPDHIRRRCSGSPRAAACCRPARCSLPGR